LTLKRRKRAAAVTFLTLAGSVFFIYFLKSVFGRARPIGCLDNGDCLSFPSGHATLAFYFYGLIGYLFFRFFPISNRGFLILAFIIALLIILISLSRLFLGVHYPSDLIGGMFLGGSWLLLAILLIDMLYCGLD
jgi:undecaprenyl-diphosphatase